VSKKAKKSGSANPTVENRRARHNYAIESDFEAGIALVGSEVKSIRAGQVSLAESYCFFMGDELFLIGARIEPWKPGGGHHNHVPDRRRKLLLHRRELDRLQKSTQRDGLYVVPLKLYFKGGRVKILIGVGRSKSQRDKRADLKDRDAKRQIARVLKRGG